MDPKESTESVSSSQFSALPSKNFVDNAEYTMVHSAGGNFWDFWLTEIDDIKFVGPWKLKLRNKILSYGLQEMDSIQPNHIAVILLPSGVGARVKILAEAKKDQFGAYNLTALDVDTGEIMITCVEKVYVPDKELMMREPYAVNCCLNLDRNHYNEAFKKHIHGGTLKVLFKRVTLSSPSKYVVDIHIKRKDELISLIELLSPESTTSSSGSDVNRRKCENEVVPSQSDSPKLERKSKISEKGEAIMDICISYIDSISKFFVWESLKCMKELKSLMDELESFYKSTSVHLPDDFVSSLSNGTVCAVYDEKEVSWCRAEIVDEIKKSSFRGLLQRHYEVFLVDFGNRIEVPISLIRSLNSKFFVQPVFAKQCRLFGIEPAPDLKSDDGLDYSRDVIEIFEMLLDLGKLTLVEAPSEENDKKDSIPVILERSYKGKDVVINLELLSQKLVMSSVFNLDICSTILKNVNSGEIKTLNIESNVSKNSYSENESSKEEQSVLKMEDFLDARNNFTMPMHLNKEEFQGVRSNFVMPMQEKKEEFQDTRSNCIMPMPSSSGAIPEEEIDDWNPMEDDYQESEITYQGLVNDDASALIGYQAKDEARICKFFATTGRCYKGSTCRKEHSFIRPDGWTTDTQLVYSSAFSYLSLPTSGSTVKLYITIVTDICKFYATLHDAWRYRETAHAYVPNDKSPEENLENLIDLINSRGNVANFKRLVMPPGVGEVVLCRKTPNNLFHRAQVIETNLEENKFLLFFVDEGSIDWMHVRNIRQIENSYLHLPFQAIDCQLAYYCAPENIDGLRKMEITRKFSKMISSKKMKAHVVRSISAINKMVVELIDDKGVNVGKALKEEGYLVELPEMYESKMKYIPG